MGLDKWLKPEGEVKKKTKEKNDKDNSLKTVSKSQKEKNKVNSQESVKSITKKLSKFELVCSNKKCKYQKTIMKKKLTQRDKTCPRCSSVMKVQKLN